jgi:hypothetical protein
MFIFPIRFTNVIGVICIGESYSYKHYVAYSMDLHISGIKYIIRLFYLELALLEGLS